MLDEEEVTDSEWECHALRLAERRAVKRASTLVRFQGWLVPIGEPDRAESPPREIIDLTNDSKDDVLNLSSKEEQQAREEEHMGVLTFHAKVEHARADPVPDTVGIGVFSHLENVGNMSWLGQIFPGYSNQENCWIIYCAY